MNDLELLHEVASDTCRCGQLKKRGNPLCTDCYYTLPIGDRDGLAKPMGKGFQEAYISACKILDTEVRW
jgi:hypothetical protein